MSRKLILGLSLACLVMAGTVSRAGMVITEWMYNGTNGEYAEFTNVGNTPVDMTNWSEDDATRTAGKHAFGSTFGIVQPGQSVIVTEADPATFRTAWNLPPSVLVFGPYSNDNLGRSDEVNLYDDLGNLVDRLTFNDAGNGGTGNVAGPRTQNIGGNIPIGALGTNNASLAVLSVNGDAYGSHLSTGGDLGSPGSYVSVPEPSTFALISLGTLVNTLRRRRRN